MVRHQWRPVIVTDKALSTHRKRKPGNVDNRFDAAPKPLGSSVWNRLALNSHTGRNAAVAVGDNNGLITVVEEREKLIMD